MRTKRTIAVLIMLMLMALPTFAPGVYATERTETVTVEVTDIKGLLDAVNGVADNVKNVNVILKNSITPGGDVLLNTKEGVTYTIESKEATNINASVRITGEGTVALKNVYINTANYSGSYGSFVPYSLWVQDTANVTVNANVIGGVNQTNILYVYGQAKVTVNGNIIDNRGGTDAKADRSGVAVSGGDASKSGPTVVINGNVKVADNGITASGYSSVQVQDVESGLANAVNAKEHATVTVKGVSGSNQLTAKNYVIASEDNAKVSVEGCTVKSSSSYGIYAKDSSQVEVTGDVKGADATAPADLTTNTANGGSGILAEDSASVKVTGNVSAGKSYGHGAVGGTGIKASGSSYVNVTGNVTAGDSEGKEVDGGEGIVANDSAKVEVGGDVKGGACHKTAESSVATCNGGNAITMGAYATVIVTGDVTGGDAEQEGEGGHGAYITAGDNAKETGKLTVYGTISGGNRGDGIRINFVTPSEAKEGGWTLSDIPEVTLWKLKAGAGTGKEVYCNSEDKTGKPSADEVNKDFNYIIRTTQAENGKIAPQKETGNAESSVKLVLTPDKGYAVSAVKTTAGKINESKGQYSITMPSYGGVEVSAEFAEAEVVPSDTPTKVNTGDNNSMVIWIVVVVVCAVAICAYVVIDKKKHK